MDQQIWLGILESERYYRYYHSLAEKFRKRQLWLDIVLILMTGGVAVTLVIHFLQGTNEVLALTLLIGIIASVVTWQHIQGYRVKTVVAGLVAAQYKSLSADWRRQWYRGQDGEDKEIVAVLTERLTSIATQAHGLGHDDKLSDYAEESADEVIYGEFTPAT